MPRFSRFLQLAKAALAGWWNDNVPRLGASLSYYTLFAIAPVLLVSIGIAGLVFGQEAVRGQVVAQIDSLVGSDAAKAIQAMLASAWKPDAGILATVVGGLTFLLGATGAFLELESALNDIWRVKSKAGTGLRGFLVGRLLSFGMVVGIAFVLMVSLVVSAALAAIGQYFDDTMPGLPLLWQTLNQLVSIGVGTLLFAMIYKVLPNVRLDWRDVWTGALVTSVLFGIGRLLIGLYLGQSGVASSYGAAGSIVVILLWVYYSSQIVLLGAEFTKVYAHNEGSRKQEGARQGDSVPAAVA
jgi:membrane protein